MSDLTDKALAWDMVVRARMDGRAQGLEKAARHLEEEADVLDAQRAELIASGTLNGRRVANEALRKRLARDNRVIIEKLLSDAQYIRTLIDKAPAP